MLGQLIRKEILDQILSFRFMVLSAAGALFIWLSLYSGYAYYQVCLRDYRLGQSATEDRLRQIAVADNWLEISAIGYLIHKPPTPTCIFVRGMEQTLGRSLPVMGFGGRLKLSPAATEPILGAFPPLDLGLIVQIVLSLFVLLFTYDAICGEKEGGTLRLIASFPVSRHQLLLAKVIGALIPALVAFGLPLLLGFAVVLLMPDVQFTGPALGRLGITLALFGLYLAIFTCVGLFSSSVTHRASTSFVVLLAFWVGSVAVLPRLAIIVADAFQPAPSVHEFQAQMNALGREGLERHRELRRKWMAEHPGWFETPEGREAYRLFFSQTRGKAREPLRPQYARLEEDFQNRFNARLSLAIALARVSPSFALKNATVRLAGTGIGRQRRFESATNQHGGRYGLWYRETKDLDNLRRVHPAKYGERKWDVSDMPRFAYRETWDEGDLEMALIDIGILAVWGLVFFLGAYVAVLRYDLR